MGIDTKISLPGNVRVHDVASVIGIAAGCKTIQRPFDHHEGYWSVHVFGVDVSATSIPSLARIQIQEESVDGYKGHFVLYHFEASRYENTRLLMPRSTAFWIAVGHRLVDFFGGFIDYNDSDDVEIDYEVPFKSKFENMPEDGEEWQSLQERLFAVVPITKEELEFYSKCSSYGNIVN